MCRSSMTAFVILLLAKSVVSVLADEKPPLAVAPFDAAQAAKFQRRWAEHIGKELVYTNSIGMDMVLLPPGEFAMGRAEGELDKLLAIIDNDPELKENRGGMLTWSMLMMPAHRARITRPFYMGACEFTVGQFRRFAEASGYKTKAEQGLSREPEPAGTPEPISPRSRRARLGRSLGGTDRHTWPKEELILRLPSDLIAEYRDWSWEARCQLSELVERALATYRESRRR